MVRVKLFDGPHDGGLAACPVGEAYIVMQRPTVRYIVRFPFRADSDAHWDREWVPPAHSLFDR
jgi:hypothetical protein